MDHLLGEHDHSLDEKNRLTLPSKHRAAFEDGVFVTRGLDGCLYAYPRPAWEQLAERIRQPRSARARGRGVMQRHFFAGAAQGELDKQGRMVIPAQPDRAAQASGGRSRWPASSTTWRSGIERSGVSSCTKSKGARKMLPSVLPTESDHVPVLAEEVVALLDPRPGETIVDCTFGAGGHSLLLAARLRGDGKLIAIDRDPTVAPFFERFRRETGVKARLHHGEFSPVLQHLARERRARPTRSCSTSASRRCSSTGPSAASRTRSTRRSTCAWIRARPTRPRDLVNESGRARARGHLQALRRGALRPPDRARDRPAPRVAAVRAHGRPGRGDQGGDSRAGPLRRGASREARLPGAAHRGERRARRARARAAGGARDAAARRPARRDLVPLARGPDRQAVPPQAGARLHVPARLPGLRLRLGADDARNAAPRGAADAPPRSPATRVRSLRACASGRASDGQPDARPGVDDRRARCAPASPHDSAFAQAPRRRERAAGSCGSPSAGFCSPASYS